MKKLPARFARPLTGALMALIMGSIMSFASLAMRLGISLQTLIAWLHIFPIMLPVGIAVGTLVGPLVATRLVPLLVDTPRTR